MNEDIVKGKWKQLQGKVQQKWGKLTNDDVDQLKGSQEELEGLLQERYGYAREKAREEIKAWANEV